MGYKETYEFWKNNDCFDEETRKELAALTDEKEIEDRFYRDLEFGTGGLRGILGAGSNRMNKYNIRKATTGFAQFLLEKFGDEAKKRGVAVAFDCRNHSDEFAKETALTMAAMGIPAYLYVMISATPLLSFTVKDLGCVGGVVVTASHNPKEYNGYKAYDETGCQLGVEDAEAVIEKVNAVDIRNTKTMSEEEALEKKLLTYIGIDEIKRYLDRVESQAHPVDDKAKKDLKIVYTPLHGAGLIPVRAIMRRCGFTNITEVEDQCRYDGNFPTVVSPNPENASALEMAIAKAEKTDADIVIATDPDSDRVGIAVKHNGKFVLPSGNQTGGLLVNYVLERRKESLNKKSTMITTVVTSNFGADIAESYGLQVKKCLTGFKFIGGVMNSFDPRENEYVLGYEESYGYLVGTHARDKDGVVTSMIIAEMAAYYKAQGKTLIDVLDDIYAKYGYYLDAVSNYVFPGKEGAEKMQALMDQIRNTGKALLPGIREIKDYNKGIDGLPKSNVLKFFLEDGSWFAIRPSGTEPKIKVYYGIKKENKESGEKAYEEYKAVIDKVLK